jgi:cation transporter-like permease
VLAASIVFIGAVAGGILLSFAFVWGFSDLLHGDGALAIVAAPVTGAILSIPVGLLFAVGLAVIASKRAQPRSDQ